MVKVHLHVLEYKSIVMKPYNTIRDFYWGLLFTVKYSALC